MASCLNHSNTQALSGTHRGPWASLTGSSSAPPCSLHSGLPGLTPVPQTFQACPRLRAFALAFPLPGTFSPHIAAWLPLASFRSLLRFHNKDFIDNLPPATHPGEFPNPLSCWIFLPITPPSLTDYVINLLISFIVDRECHEGPVFILSAVRKDPRPMGSSDPFWPPECWDLRPKEPRRRYSGGFSGARAVPGGARGSR